jgi:hypothetical protein
VTRALADTSVFVALEQGRPRRRRIPDEILISVVTIGELQLGVLMADDAVVRAVRLKTLTYVESTFEPVPVDGAAAREWARLVAQCKRRRRRVPVNDLWIAATAIVRKLARTDAGRRLRWDSRALRPETLKRARPYRPCLVARGGQRGRTGCRSHNRREGVFAPIASYQPGRLP